MEISGSVVVQIKYLAILIADRVLNETYEMQNLIIMGFIAVFSF